MSQVSATYNKRNTHTHDQITAAAMVQEVVITNDPTPQTGLLPGPVRIYISRQWAYTGAGMYLALFIMLCTLLCLWCCRHHS